MARIKDWTKPFLNAKVTNGVNAGDKIKTLFSTPFIGGAPGKLRTLRWDYFKPANIPDLLDAIRQIEFVNLKLEIEPSRTCESTCSVLVKPGLPTPGK